MMIFNLCCNINDPPPFNHFDTQNSDPSYKSKFSLINIFDHYYLYLAYADGTTFFLKDISFIKEIVIEVAPSVFIEYQNQN